MCVILISYPDKPRVTPLMVRQADAANRDGIGAGWLDNGKVCWQKGLTVETATVLAASLPQPYMLHFRMATIGAPTAALTHPFPLFGNITNDLKGSTHHGIMMHNGHWSGWEKEFKKRANAHWVHNYITDKMAWSDSRGMAWLASRIGYHVLPKIAATGQKIALLTTRGVKIYGHGWTEVDGVTASNTYFQWGSCDYSGHWWDREWDGGYTGYQGYLYRTRRRKALPPATTVGDRGARIAVIEVDEDALGETALGEFVYPSQRREKKIGDLTDAEWLAREEALMAEDEDWNKDKLSFYGREE